MKIENNENDENDENDEDIQVWHFSAFSSFPLPTFSAGAGSVIVTSEHVQSCKQTAGQRGLHSILQNKQQRQKVPVLRILRILESAIGSAGGVEAIYF